MHLVIVESPAKCGKIQGFLGEGYSVVATMGHIRALKEDLAAIGLTSDFALTYTFLEEKSRAIHGLKSAAARATSVILAADDDREGEAIAYSVCVLLGLDPATTARAVFHEITKKAVVAAVASPRTLDMNRVNAQQARAALDMMIGFTISPLLWKNVARGLSAGRCQTPALRLVCDREEAIGAHVAEMSWRVTGTWKGAAALTFDAHLADALEDEESARNYLETMHEESAATIYRATTRPWNRAPPLPFITSTLQQAASAVLRSGPKKTMAAAQKLYEAGYITYMRTDSAVLSSEAADAARAIVKERWGAEFCSAGTATAPAAMGGLKKKKGAAMHVSAGPQQPQAQEAHEAIRPTHFEMEDIPAIATLEWTGPERRLYKLIWLRAIQSVMAPMQGEEATIQFLLGVSSAEAAATEAASSFPWSANWRRTTFLGWRKAGQAAEQGDDSAAAEATEDADTATWDKVIRLGPGDTVRWQTAHAKPHATAAPRRYNEATLIQALEKSGIGRPSTFASLVGTILDKSYVEKKDIAGHEEEVKELSLSGPTAWPPAEKTATRTVGGERERLVPTELGRAALGFAVKHFADLFAYDFTAAMEARLDAVARGEEEWKQLLRDTWSTYKERYEALGSGQGSQAKNTATKKIFRDGLTAIVRKTGAPLLLKETPGAAKGAKPTFYGWPEGVAFADMTEEVALQFIAGRGQDQGQGQVRPQAEGDILGHWNGEAIVKRKGKFGTYIVCGKLTATCGEDVSLEDAIERLEAKASMQTRVIGPYELRRTDRGAYMFKTTVKAKKFVTVPDGLDIMKLTAGEVEAIYKTATPAANREGYKTAAPAAGPSGGNKTATPAANREGYKAAASAPSPTPSPAPQKKKK